MKKFNLKSCLMLLACLAFSFNFMACTDDDGDSDGPEVDDSIRTRTFESADYNSGWKYFSFIYICSYKKTKRHIKKDISNNIFYK